MNHKLIVVSFIILYHGCFNASYSQEETTAQNSMKLGLIVGLNYPDIRFENDEYGTFTEDNFNDFEIGYIVGLSFDYYFTDNFSLKTNILYDRKHRKKEILYLTNFPPFNVTGSDYFDVVYHYINIPVLAKYEFLNNSLFVNGGPFFNYLLSLDREREFLPELGFERKEQNNVDFGLSFGIGGIIPINDNNEIIVELRNDLGFIDIGGFSERLDGYAKTNTLKFVVGWNFDL